MKREWQPGDVAVVNDTTRPKAPWRPATCVVAAILNVREAEWRLHGSGARVWGSVSDARPLAVIDFEDREQVERLWTLLRDGRGLQSRDNLTAALREFTTPTPIKCQSRLFIDGIRHICERDADHKGYHEALTATRLWGEVS